MLRKNLDLEKPNYASAKKSAIRKNPAMSSTNDSNSPTLPEPELNLQQTVLMEFKKLHDRLDKMNNEIVSEIRGLNQRVCRLENQCKSKAAGMPCRPACLPIKNDQDLDGFENLSPEKYDDVVRYFEFVTGFNTKETVNNIMKEAILDQYAMDITWHGKNDKTPFINTRLSKAIFEALSKNTFFDTPNSKEFQCAVTEALRNSKQRVRNKKEVVTPGHENRKRTYIKIKEEYG